MGSSRLFWKVFALQGAICIGLASVAWGLLVVRQEPLVHELEERRLLDVSLTMRGVVRELLRSGERERLKELVTATARETGVRLTVVQADGEVLADSSRDPQELSSHKDRPEFRGAAGPDRYGVARRDSSSVGKPMVYVAVPIFDGERPSGFVRAASETRQVDGRLLATRVAILAAGLIGLAASAASASVALRRVVEPMDELTRRVAELGGAASDSGSADSSGESAATSLEGDASGESEGDRIERLDASLSRLENGFAKRISGYRADAERLANVLANMAEGVLALDGRQRIVLANEACRRLLEFVTQEPEGRPLWEVLRSRTIEEAVAEAIHSGRPVWKEFESNAGARRILTLRACRLPGDPSPGVMIVLHDVTDLRRLENLRREFVANVSHELKTPLASIKAYAETLRMGAVNDAEHNMAFVERIEEQADRLHELILDLLHLARVESGEESFEITSVSLGPVVAACVHAYEAKAAGKRIELTVERSARPVWVRADEEGVRTILSNLVDNAIKYTPEGGRVTIRSDQDGREGWLEVQDTGIGIGKQHHARIFERFYRVDKARSRELGGTGLGLSIVKHLTQAFGGQVRVESRLRAGTTFRVTLPLADPVDSDEAP